MTHFTICRYTAPATGKPAAAPLPDSCTAGLFGPHFGDDAVLRLTGCIATHINGATFAVVDETPWDARRARGMV